MKTPRLRKKRHTIQATYPSMSNLAAAAGIPVEALRRAKSKGCPAFRQNNSVVTIDLLRWLLNGESSGEVVDYSIERAKREQAERRIAEVEAAQAEGSAIDIEDARAFIHKTFQPVREKVVAMPGALAAHVNPADPPHALGILKGWSDQFLKQCKEVKP